MWLGATHECLELNSGLPQGQPVLMTPAPSAAFQWDPILPAKAGHPVSYSPLLDFCCCESFLLDRMGGEVGGLLWRTRAPGLGALVDKEEEGGLALA